MSTTAGPALTSGNPALSGRVTGEHFVPSAAARMTIGGTALKTALLLVVLVVGGVVGWDATVKPVGAVDEVTGYAKGYVLGSISAMFEAQTEGIVGAAVVATVAVFVALFGVRDTVVSIFNWSWLYSEEFRTVGIIATIIAVILAALSLTPNFGSIEGGVEAGAPRVMGSCGAYALMVTLIWLYLTLLRLLALLTRNR